MDKLNKTSSKGTKRKRRNDENDAESIKDDGAEKDNLSSLSIAEEHTQPKDASKPTGIQLQNTIHYIQTNISASRRFHH